LNLALLLWTTMSAYLIFSTIGICPKCPREDVSLVPSNARRSFYNCQSQRRYQLKFSFPLFYNKKKIPLYLFSKQRAQGLIFWLWMGSSLWLLLIFFIPHFPIFKQYSDISGWDFWGCIVTVGDRMGYDLWGHNFGGISKD
jgi:hypothetical protein